MDLIMQLKEQLDHVKSISGVENVLLTQRDGNPITSSGVWLSKNEIFNVSAATSAIYNVGITMHGRWLKYMIIEGNKAKIMIAPLVLTNDVHGPQDYYVAITTLSNVNLGNIFLKTKNSLEKIHALISSCGEDFTPPLREFNKAQVQNIMESFNARDDYKEEVQVYTSSITVDVGTYKECNEVLNNLHKMVNDLVYSSIAFKGGYIVDYIQPSPDFNLTPDEETAMSFSLYDTSSRYAWLLKRMEINSIFLDCNHYMQFIHGFDNGIFSSYIFTNNQRVGFIRLVLPKFLGLIKKILRSAVQVEEKMVFSPDNVVDPLLIR